MRLVPEWALLSSGCAPLLLVGGWAIAGVLEGPGHDPATTTISVLAADGAPGSWVMTGALAALGICHLLTAWALRPAAPAGRMALACGGVATLMVAGFPAPGSGGSLRHGTLAAVGFALLAVWPVLAALRSTTAPWGLRPAPAIGATALMALGAAWFLVELQIQGAAGTAERTVTLVQNLWPFVVVASCFRHPGREEPGR